jgi:nucleotide-binding universal stress UspA family protein
MKKILVPTDFSEPGNWAVEVAASIAKKMYAQVTLLHIVELPSAESFNVEGQVDNFSDWEDKLFALKLIDKSKQLLSEAAESLRNQGITVNTALRIGNTFHGIRTIITDQKADLVIMGTLGRSRFEEILIGSNTEKVVRYSKCPVLTVHHRSANINFKKIVYATSMSEDEKDFAQVLREIQEIFGSEIYIVRINTPMNFRPDTEVTELMDIFAKKLHLKNYTLRVFNDHSEEEGILHFASSIGADLIAMATHGRTGFAHVLAGSIAEDVVNHASRPVLTYVTSRVYH